MLYPPLVFALLLTFFLTPATALLAQGGADTLHVEAGGSVSGTLSSERQTVPITFTAPRDGWFTVRVTSSELDPILAVEDPRGAIGINDDADWSTGDARWDLVATGETRYTFRVSSFLHGPGRFTLVVEAQDWTVPKPVSVRPGETLRDTLRASSPPFPVTGGHYAEFHYVAQTSGQATVAARSQAFDTWLSVFDGVDRDAPLIAENDDLNPDVGSDAQVRFPVETGQEYRILLASFDRDSVGEYTISLEEAGRVGKNQHALEVLARRHDELAALVKELSAQRNQSRACDARLPNELVRPDDEFHPARFLRVVEREGTQSRTAGQPRGKVLSVLWGSDPDEEVGSVTSAETDHRSNIWIEFNRDSLRSAVLATNVSIAISARVIRQDGSEQPVEVPGYAEVGKETKAATSVAGSVRLISETFCGLVAPTEAILDQILEQRAFLAAERTADVEQAFQALAQVVATAEATIDPSLVRLADSPDSVALRFIAGRVGATAAGVRGLARQGLLLRQTLETRLSDEQEDSDAVRRDILAYMQVVTSLLDQFKGTWQNLKQDMILALQQDFVASVVDAQISLPSSGAAPGDRLVIETSFGPPGGTARTLTVIVSITRFGLTSQTTDNLLFLNRRDGDLLADAALSDEMSAQAITTSSRVVRTIAARVDFEPTAAVNFGWTVYPRGRKVIRFLHPGFGLTAAVMKWGTRTATAIPPSAAGEPAAFSLERTDGALEIGVGVYGSLFNGAVTGVLGWNSGARAGHPFFVGFGLSFVQTLSALKDKSPGS